MRKMGKTCFSMFKVHLNFYKFKTYSMKLKLHVALTMTLLIFSQMLFAQGRTVTGTVTESDTKESLPGVSVVLEGTTKGTVTDLDGKYAIEIESDLDVLVFSYIGMNTQRIEVGTKSTIDVSLQSGVDLDEFVVTATKFNLKKENTGKVIHKITQKELQQNAGKNVIEILNNK
mgnify:CR=1 FL=1